jgi:hypothetical protein
VAASAADSLPHHTVEVEIKFVPVMVSLKPALPATAEVALSDVIAGSPMSRVNAGDVAAPLPGFSTVRLTVPLVVRSPWGIVTVMAVAVPALAVNLAGVGTALVLM